RGQETAESADPGADFHDFVAYIGQNGVGKPTVETRSCGERLQSFLTRVRVNITTEMSFQDDIKGFEGILQSDLFAFFVCATMIADGRFIDSRLSLRKFDGQLRLNAKAVAANGHALDQRSTEGLVASFHIGEVHIGKYVAQSSEQ